MGEHWGWQDASTGSTSGLLTQGDALPLVPTVPEVSWLQYFIDLHL